MISFALLARLDRSFSIRESKALMAPLSTEGGAGVLNVDELLVDTCGERTILFLDEFSVVVVDGARAVSSGNEGGELLYSELVTWSFCRILAAG